MVKESDGYPDGHASAARDKLLGIGFTVWALVVPVTAWLFIEQQSAVSGSVAAGILPIAEERIKTTNRRIDRVIEEEWEWRTSHVNWSQREEENIEKRQDACERRLAVLEDRMNRENNGKQSKE